MHKETDLYHPVASPSPFPLLPEGSHSEDKGKTGLTRKKYRAHLLGEGQELYVLSRGMIGPFRPVMGHAVDDKDTGRQPGGFRPCGKESRTTTEWCMLWMDGDVRTPAKKPRSGWKSGGDSVIFILGSGSLDSIEVVDGKAGPYGPGIPNRNLSKPLRDGLGHPNARKAEHGLFHVAGGTSSPPVRKILNMQFRSSLP